MKPLSYLIILAAFLFFPIVGRAQQNAQWPFYLAFEDATGAKDTIWLVMDEMATWSMDPEFGEMPIDIPADQFACYTHFSATEYTDTRAFNINSSAIGVEIYASSYILPIILRWDRSFFADNILMVSGGDTIINAFIENDFFLPIDQDLGLNMHLTDSVVLPKFEGDHFPLYISLDRLEPIGIQSHHQIILNIAPNPVTDHIQIESPALLEKIEVRDISGRLVYSAAPLTKTKQVLDISGFKAGVYFLVATSGEKTGVKKFVKMK